MRQPLVVVFLFGAAAVACGDSPGNGNADLGLPDLTPPSVEAEFGLDVRPSNPTCLAPARPPATSAIRLQRVFPNLSFDKPVAAFQAPRDSSRWYVVEQGGGVVTFPNMDSTSSRTDFIRFPAGKAYIGGIGEGGLLGMAFHPDWATNRTVFLSYTAKGAIPGSGVSAPMYSIIARFTSSDNGATLALGSEQPVLRLNQPFENHNGGQIAYGPDGYFYIGFGDGGSGGDPQNNSQNLSVLLGKLLRINLPATGAYTIPSDNPFASGGGAPEIYAYGLRNPWRWSWDRATNELWLGDVGQDTYEEIDKIVKGGNYGWRVREATHCFNPMTGCQTAGLIDPIVEYDHSLGKSVTGGYVYRGSAIPSLVGKYLFGDYVGGRMWTIDYDADGNPSRRELLQTGLNIASFAEDVDGELYVVHYGGELYKIVANGTPPSSAFPEKLSQTGCVVPGDPKTLAAGVISYELNSALWSDGADKQRAFAIPDGTTITIGADGDWDFPNRSVVLKTFLLGGKRIETRLLVRHDDGGWAGYTYEWDDAETDATLLPSSKTRAVGQQTWYYPSRPDCVTCHTQAAGRTLGLETAQLNRDHVYLVPGETLGRKSNQLTTLDHIGLFSAPLAGTPVTLPALPSLGSAAPVADRARSYLHANCSNCHRPGGPGQGGQDFRYTTSFAMAGLCNVTPQSGTLGVTNAVLIAPGEPARSVVPLRMKTRGANQMPPLGTSLIHPDGVAVVEDWIRSLTSCP